jgi:Xaa-Pro aminopeptidase
LLLVEPGSATLITDFRYRSQAAEETGEEIAVVIAESNLFEGLSRCLEEGGPGPRIGFDEQALSVGDRRALGEACGGVMWEPAGAIVPSLRSVKDPGEIESIERAVGVAEAALASVLDIVSEGITEADVAAELVYRLRKGGSESLPFEPIVASGERSALPHASPGQRRLGERDLLLLDFGAIVDGYCSDMTRTFVLGAAAPWQREVHATVHEAVDRAVEALEASVPTRDVDRASRDVIEAAGFGERFGHGTGHGLGLEVHEIPRLNARSRETLEAGNVVTIEPGVYLPGRGGVRLEEVVLVEEGGCRVLSAFPLSLQEL